MPNTRICPNCEGYGRLMLLSSGAPVKCDVCDGKGFIEVKTVEASRE